MALYKVKVYIRDDRCCWRLRITDLEEFPSDFHRWKQRLVRELERGYKDKSYFQIEPVLFGLGQRVIKVITYLDGGIVRIVREIVTPSNVMIKNSTRYYQ